MKLKAPFAAIGLLLALSAPAFAQSGCGGQAGAGKFCGNNTGSTGLPGFVTVPAGSLTPIAGGTVIGNPTGSVAPPIATNSPVLVGTLTISPAAGPTQGLVVSQPGLIGAIAGTVSSCTAGNPAFAYNQICITNDQSSVTGATDPKFTFGNSIALLTGGSTTGGKIAQNIFLQKFAASTPTTARDHVALNINALIDAGDNGTGTTSSLSKGTMFAGGFDVTARSGATNLFGLVNMELGRALQTGSSAYYSAVLNLVDKGNKQADGIDAAIIISGGGAGNGFGSAVLFSDLNGGLPACTTCALIKSATSTLMTVGSIMDFSTNVAATYLLQGPSGFYIDGNANLVGASATLGGVGLSSGVLALKGTTSGSASIVTQAVQGTPSIAIPTGSGTLVTSVTAPIVIDPVLGRISCATCATTSGGGTISTLTFGTHLTSGGSSYNGSAGVTITSDATNLNTASTIVARDGSGNFMAGIVTASLTGHASLDLALTGGTMAGAIAMGSNNITGVGNIASTTFNGNTFTTGTGVLTIAASKTLTVSNTLTFTGTDGSSVAFGTGGTVLYGNQTVTLSGDVTGSGATAITTVLVNIPTGVTAAGTILHSNIAAPSTPASGKVIIWTDSIDLRFHDKNSAGVIGTTVVADTGAANSYISAISAAGAVTKSRPACSTLSDSGAGCTAATMTATIGGLVPTPPNNTTTFLRGDGTFASVVGADVALTSAHIFVGNAGNVAADVAMSGDVSIANTGATTLVTAQPAVHTWALAQTFTVAPVFTDQSGSRAALGLGTMATQNASAVAITGGTIAGLTGFAIRDTSAAFDVTIAATSGTALTAGRTLTLNMGNVAHTLAFGTTANTITFPNAASDTVAMLGVGNTFSAVQTISVNGANQLVVKALASNNSYIQLDTSATTVQAGLAFNENGAAKWSFIKQTDNSFLIFDNVNGIVAQFITPGATTVGSVNFGYTTDSTSATTGSAVAAGGFAAAKSITVGGHILASGSGGTTPTISSCGVSPSISGSDNFGSVTAGTGILATCVVNFGKTWGAAPRCVASSGTAIASMTVTSTTTQLTIGGTSLTGDAINWVCGSTASNDNIPLHQMRKFA